MDKIKISAVSYTNTKPFILGIERSGLFEDIDLSLDIPSDCAQKLIEGKVDIGLIPVAAIPHVKGANIVTDYCIGSVGAVNSVFIFSNVPYQEIRTVRLDRQSRTSNNLAKVLLKFHWKQEVDFVNDASSEADAIVLIGDRTFGQKEKFKYAYDMGEEWLNFTGLPFTYAAWVANKEISPTFISSFNAALKLGLSQRTELIAQLPKQDDFDLDDYLMHKLDFDLTADKRVALDKFLGYVTAL